MSDSASAGAGASTRPMPRPPGAVTPRAPRAPEQRGADLAPDSTPAQMKRRSFTWLGLTAFVAVITGCTVRVPPPLHLIAMKLHALRQEPERDYKDWPDICHLLESQPDEWTREMLKVVVDRYASEQYGEMLRLRGYL